MDIPITDLMRARLEAHAAADLRPVEMQAAWLLATYLDELEERNAERDRVCDKRRDDAARQRRSRDKRRVTCDVTEPVTCGVTSPPSSPSPLPPFSSPAPHLIPPDPTPSPTPTHIHAREGRSEEVPFSEPVQPLRPDEEPELKLTTPALLKPATPAPKPKGAPNFNDERFTAFRAAYTGPRCKEWAKALEVWQRDKLGSDERFPLVMQALAEDKASQDWQRENGSYIPAPTPWLNKRRWMDITLAAASAPNPYQHKPWGDLWTQAGFPASQVGLMNFCAQQAPHADPYEAGQLFLKGGLDLAASYVLERRGAC